MRKKLLPLNPYQIFSACTIAANLILLLVCVIFLALSLFQVCLYLLALVSFIFLGVSGVVISVLNPSEDPFVVDESANFFFCSICNLSVSRNAKHCGSCNRCVLNFDHHCVWLNNCICNKNYKTFLLVLISLEVHSLSSLIFYVSLFANQVSLVYSFLGILIIIESLIYLSAFAAVFLLILFHIYLKCRSMTTYEYLVLSKAKVSIETNHVTKSTHSLDLHTSGTEAIYLKPVSRSFL